jgi:hypothetical protein
MKIKMTKSIEGASNSYGTTTKTYMSGETYAMDSDWELALAKVFTDNLWASEVGGKKKKVVSPSDNKKEELAIETKAEKI